MPLAPEEGDRLYGRLLFQLEIVDRDEAERRLSEEQGSSARVRRHRLQELLCGSEPDDLGSVCPACGRVSSEGDGARCAGCGSALFRPDAALDATRTDAPPAAVPATAMLPETRIAVGPPRPKGEFCAGQRLGRYRLEQNLGVGATGTVWKAREEGSERAVALKLLHPSLNAEPDMLERFRREAEVVGRLDHPNLVRVFELGTVDGVSYISMELVSGCSYGDFLDQAGGLRDGGANPRIEPPPGAVDARSLVDLLFEFDRVILW